MVNVRTWIDSKLDSNIKVLRRKISLVVMVLEQKQQPKKKSFFFPFSRTQLRITCEAQCHVSLASFNLKQFYYLLRFWHFFLSAGQVFYRMFPSWGSSDISSWLDSTYALGPEEHSGRLHLSLSVFSPGAWCWTGLTLEIFHVKLVKVAEVRIHYQAAIFMN